MIASERQLSRYASPHRRRESRSGWWIEAERQAAVELAACVPAHRHVVGRRVDVALIALQRIVRVERVAAGRLVDPVGGADAEPGDERLVTAEAGTVEQAE